MEHLPAGELFDYIVAQGRIRDESVARKLFRQIVAGVAHTHQEGFSHRDLKPENMLFDDQKALKLIDFGLVAMPGTRECRTSCGSANYAAPEVLYNHQKHPHKIKIPSLELPSMTVSNFYLNCCILQPV